MLKPLIREYIERLAGVHTQFPALMDAAQARLKGAVDGFVAKYPGHRGLVVAIPVDERGVKQGDPVYMTATVME